MINSANASTYEHFIPPGADLAIKYGLTMRIVPAQRLDWSAGFTAQTEKYSGQVGLDKDDFITNYVAGMPFPTVSPNDPKAAVKIAYNWHMGPFMPDDFTQEPWEGSPIPTPTPTAPSSKMNRMIMCAVNDLSALCAPSGSRAASHIGQQ